ncbi:universal stress protein [Rhodobacteraceae bacterium WD3A24]|nr:universal stress protein [Rhodobacteraceae bacterium WD3A24]
MSYKTILSFISREAAIETTLAPAITMTRREDAHLELSCLGIDHTQTGYFYAGAPAMVYQETLERAQKEAEALEEKVRARMSREDVRWSVDSSVAQLGGIAALTGLRARFADLVVQPRPYGDEHTPEDEAIIESALFEGETPVLVVPNSGLPADRPRRVVVAWNQSSEALSAVRKALPILREAEIVNVAIIDPPSHGPERSDPGGMLTQMLSRHGVRAEVSVLARTMPRISDVLLRHVSDQSADMLVMGAYGHSRFREAIMGGATRDMLEQTEVPLFMAH